MRHSASMSKYVFKCHVCLLVEIVTSEIQMGYMYGHKSSTLIISTFYYWSFHFQYIYTEWNHSDRAALVRYPVLIYTKEIKIYKHQYDTAQIKTPQQIYLNKFYHKTSKTLFRTIYKIFQAFRWCIRNQIKWNLQYCKRQLLLRYVCVHRIAHITFILCLWT